MVPFKPESRAALRARLYSILDKIYTVEDIRRGGSPALDPKHVFDNQNRAGTFRAIINLVRGSDVIPKFEGDILQVSVSSSNGPSESFTVEITESLFGRRLPKPVATMSEPGMKSASVFWKWPFPDAQPNDMEVTEHVGSHSDA